jgi:hypothetical protein
MSHSPPRLIAAAITAIESEVATAFTFIAANGFAVHHEPRPLKYRPAMQRTKRATSGDAVSALLLATHCKHNNEHHDHGD